MLIRNKHLKKLGVLYDTPFDKKFFKKHGFDISETYTLDFSTLCFFYTRLKVFRKKHSEFIADPLPPGIDDLILKLEGAITNRDLGVEEFKALCREVIEILPYCYW